jgi:glutathione reductase (NADPH)
MSNYDFDLFVIGGGSGGVRAARMSAQFGARVALCEERYMGGTCVNVGCVPKKLLVYGSHIAEEWEDAAGYGWSVEKPSFDWKRMIANKDKEITRLNGIYRSLLDNAGVKVIDGRGSLVDAHTVQVDGVNYTCEHILVATGGWPTVPEIPGGEHIITSNEAFFLEELPRHITIVGGGYIAVEFAGIFQGFGSQVTQLYRGPLFLRGFDDDARSFLAGEMQKKGVDLRFNIDVEGIEKTAEGLKLSLSDGSQLTTDLVMYATGRAPNATGLGLEELGVECNWRGAVVVDEYLRTNLPSIHALGDVTDKLQLTPVALAEGMALAKTLFGGEPTMVDYENVATAVFSQPCLGTVGLTEAAARSHHGEVTIYKSAFTPMKHTLTQNTEKTLMKLIVDTRTDVVVGVHVVAPEAGEIIQGVAIALKCGATKAQFDATIGIHPTAAEELVTMRTPEPEPARAAAG